MRVKVVLTEKELMTLLRMHYGDKMHVTPGDIDIEIKWEKQTSLAITDDSQFVITKAGVAEIAKHVEKVTPVDLSKVRSRKKHVPKMARSIREALSRSHVAKWGDPAYAFLAMTNMHGVVSARAYVTRKFGADVLARLESHAAVV